MSSLGLPSVTAQCAVWWRLDFMPVQRASVDLPSVSSSLRGWHTVAQPSWWFCSEPTSPSSVYFMSTFVTGLTPASGYNCSPRSFCTCLRHLPRGLCGQIHSPSSATFMPHFKQCGLHVLDRSLARSWEDLGMGELFIHSFFIYWQLKSEQNAEWYVQSHSRCMKTQRVCKCVCARRPWYGVVLAFTSGV